MEAFALLTDYTKDEAHHLCKKYVCPDIMTYKKNGISFEVSTADLDTKQMTEVIDRFRRWSEDKGYPLPSVENEEWQSLVLNESERRGQNRY